MGDKTGIEWTDATWNPVTGCDKVSPGCDHCYAETFAERWRGTEGHYFANGFDVQLRPDKLSLPLRWTKPRKVFVNSMSDLFHDKVPDDFVAEVFAVMACNYLWDRPTHTFQLLTKRHGRMRSLLLSEDFRASVARKVGMRSEDGDSAHDAVFYHFWPLPNVWLGVSAEDQKRADLRIPALVDTPAAVRFVSAEPLLGPIDLHKAGAGCTSCDGSGIGWGKVPDGRWMETDCGDCEGGGAGLDWVIVGGESGCDDRPMHSDWVRSLRDQCVEAGVPFLFKQWGETVPLGQMTDQARQRWDDRHGSDVYPDESLWRVGKRHAGRELDGRTWDQYPEAVA